MVLTKNRITEKLSVVALALITALLMMLFAGCANFDASSISVDLQTEINIDGNFAGERVMTVTFNRQNAIDAFGSLDVLDSLVNEAMPSQFVREYKDGETTASYVFRLKFSSLSDYKAKITALTGEIPEIVFERSDRLFMKGLTYQENFESRDLFAWADEAANKLLAESGTDTFDSANFWRQAGVVINVGDKTYSSPGGRVEVTEGKATLVTKISFRTINKASGLYERTIEIRLISELDENSFTEILTYFESNKPLGAVVTQSSVNGQPAVCVEFRTRNLDDLAQKTSAVLGNTCTAAYAPAEDSSLPFSTIEEFTETLDFSLFCLDSQIPFSYNIISERGSPSAINVSIDGVPVDAQPTLGGNTLDYGAQACTAVLSTRFERISSAETIYYNLIMKGADSYKREIIIVMDGNTTKETIERIKSFYESKNAKNTVIETLPDGLSEQFTNPCVRIVISGTGKEVVRAEETLFAGSTERQLGYTKSQSILKVKPDTELIDRYDISSLLSMTNVTEYFYTCTTIDGIKSASVMLNDSLNSSMSETEKKKTVGFRMQNGAAEMTFGGSYTNATAIVFIILLIIFALLVLTLIAVLVWKYIREKNREDVQEQPKEEVRQLPEPDEPVSEPIALFPPIRDLFIEEEEYEKEPEIEIQSVPETTVTEEVYVPTGEELREQDQRHEEAVQEEPKSHKVKVRPVVPFGAEEEKPEEPVVIPEPEPAPIVQAPAPEPERYNPADRAPEVPYTQSPYHTYSEEEYTDEDMLRDFAKLGLLDDYVERVSKVKIKVKKHKPDNK